jgi:hypothetical protein
MGCQYQDKPSWAEVYVRMHRPVELKTVS